MRTMWPHGASKSISWNENLTPQHLAGVFNLSSFSSDTFASSLPAFRFHEFLPLCASEGGFESTNVSRRDVSRETSGRPQGGRSCPQDGWSHPQGGCAEPPARREELPAGRRELPAGRAESVARRTSGFANVAGREAGKAGGVADGTRGIARKAGGAARRTGGAASGTGEGGVGC